MSTCESSPRRRRNDDGFTLIEIVVALGLLAIVMTAALPVFVSMLRATAVTKMNTQAKNLAQQRLDQMRNLKFHVDRQNGPFLDLLDMYYTNATSAGPMTTLTIADGVTLKGAYVATGAASGGEPAAPFYRVNTSSLSTAMAGATTFTQTVDTQFLAADGTVLPATRYQDLYDSQVVGKDQPPSLMLGVTVITRWTQGGVPRTYRTYTRITDGRPQQAVIQSQSRATAVDITSTASNGNTLQLRAGVTNLDGAQSSGSSVLGYAAGAIASQTGQTPVTGQVSQFALPTQSPVTSGSSSPTSPCSWYGFGSTGTTDVTGDVNSGLPKAPTDVDVATPPNVVSGYIATNGAGPCGQLSYDNLAGGATGLSSSDAIGYEMGGAPYVKIPDTSTGSGPSISGSGYVTATPLTATPHLVKSGSSVAMGQPLVLFPSTPEPSSGRGLVSVQVTSGSVDCVSGASGTVTGKFTLTLGWWGQHGTDPAEWRTSTWTYDSTATPAMVQTGDSWDPANTYLSNGTTLSQLLSLSPTTNTPNVVTIGANTGLRGFPSGILTISTAPTRSTTVSDPSAINVRLGYLTCVADDLR